MIKKYYCISEYGFIASKKDIQSVEKGSVVVEKSIFEELEEFILKNNNCFNNEQTSQFLTISYKSGIGKVLKSQNYVGIIQTKSGITIEILPKIYKNNEEMSYAKTIKIFLKMLKCVKNCPFKKFNLTSLKTAKMNLLDIFINMFLEELGTIIKKRLKSNYINKEDNLNFYKGKLNIQNQIRHNIVHKEKFYVEFDEYNMNTPENRIIKSTLVYLKNKTYNEKIEKTIREYIFVLDEVNESKNINLDIEKCSNSRIMSEYDIVLKWCKIFLNKESFTSYKGNNIAYSLLYPMEKIFESYVGKSIKNYEELNEWNVYLQHNKYYLLENPKLFKLKPDIVMENKNEIIILDTKWKLLNNEDELKYGISQSDLYQMYAYAKKYESKNIILIYPKQVQEETKEKMNFKFEENINLNILCVDLENIDKSMKELKDIINIKINKDYVYKYNNYENIKNKMKVIEPKTFQLPENLNGISIHSKVIPTLCNLKNLLYKLVEVHGNEEELKQWEKRCYKGYYIEKIKNEILNTTQDEWITIIRRHILYNPIHLFGANVKDIYLVAYVSKIYGVGKEIFTEYIKNTNITDKDGSINAIWQVGKGDGVFLEILNEDGSIKDWNFIKQWVD